MKTKTGICMVLLIYTRPTSHNFGYASFLALLAMRKSERHAPRDKLTFKSGLRVGFRVRISSQDLESGSRVRISSQDLESGSRVRISSQDLESGFRVRISSQDLESGSRARISRQDWDTHFLVSAHLNLEGPYHFTFALTV